MNLSLRCLSRGSHTALIYAPLAGVLLLGLFAPAAARGVRADDGCDSSEAVACIALPSDASVAPGGVPSFDPIAAGSAAPARAAAAAIPCPALTCCYAGGGPAVGYAPASAAPIVPVGICPAPPPPYGWCPTVMPADAAPAPSPSVAAPLPVTLSCSPYRSIYTTINLGNAADVRALRTLSTQGLSAYWRSGALDQIQSQVAQLQLAGLSASTRLYSIRVQDSSFSAVNRAATVHTLEHWLYQQRSLDDGSVLISQDQWVANEYDLDFVGNAWYITYNSATLSNGPAPVPLPATGG